MVNVTNVLHTGGAIIIEIAFGYVACKLKLFKPEATNAINRFLLKCCYLPMITRAIAIKDLGSLSFMPFLVAILTITINCIILGAISLMSKCFKSRFYMFLSTYLPSHYVNYLIIGLPIFISIWSEEENHVVAVQNMSGDLYTVPLYLIFINIFNVQRSNIEHKKANDGIVEKIDWHLPLDILIRIVTNNFIIGNALGFIYAATKWKMCPYLWDIMKYLGDSVLALAMFTVGGFLSRHSVIACNFLHLVVTLCIRHITFPIVAGLLCYAFRLDPRLSRQIMILTCLPTATAAFLMNEENKTGPGVASSMILWSTILVIPFIIIWLLVLDKLGIFVEET
ncbi:Auxin Efflux Carrier family protein [Tritrichomonas foetus]|uniref:Auxin Efflux Carrier family protein n=1 Tax=Tritrichomonas foetus TaxID=1144522 RepID=A0A1J4KNF7_9EUKA|nr:Auxin Efflux Carrier family protein [Tritrichomonas foetus]|eukprot:OHT12658.1 Auxin Efflux Carrier family protein [Tritrichomonas foetus]